MNSSTSNFKTRSRKGGRGVGRIALALLLIWGVSEAGARKYARRHQFELSDHGDFTSIDARAAQLMKERGTKVVLVGNSVTLEGFDLPLLESTLGTKLGAKQGAKATMCAAVDSKVREWNWMLEHAYFGPGRRPDLFVVTYFADNLADVPVVERGRMAQFFTSPRDWPAVLQNDLDTLGERADFLFSYVSLLYAMRAVTQDKLLSLSAPGYHDLAVELNDVQGKQLRGAEASQSKAAGPKSHQALRHLLKRARQSGARLCFLSYPRTSGGRSYAPDVTALKMIREAGMISLDLRATPGLTADKYRDGVHMNAKGRPIWTKAVARALAPVVAGLKPGLGK